MEQLDLNKAVALFDLDSAVYRSGFACESKSYFVWQGDTLISAVKTMTEANEIAKVLGFPEDIEIRHQQTVEPVENALANMKNIIERTKSKFNCPWELYLTGKGNFRYDLAKTLPYKGNRELMLKPVHYGALRNYAMKWHGARNIEGMEADDEIGIRSTELIAEGKIPIIASIDKDLKQLGGWNYDWVKDVLTYIPELEAKRFYYTQILTGDRTDNIPGIDGVGPKTAEKMLASARNEREMLKIVKQAYKDNRILERLPEIGTLLWLQRTREIKTWGNYTSDPGVCAEHSDLERSVWQETRTDTESTS